MENLAQYVNKEATGVATFGSRKGKIIVGIVQNFTMDGELIIFDTKVRALYSIDNKTIQVINKN